VAQIHVVLPATSSDFAWFLNGAQDSSQDILSHLGLVEARWDTVVWIVKKLVEGGSRSLEPPLHLEPFANVIWPETESRTLKHLTESPLVTTRVRPSKPLKHSLDQLTAAPDTINLEHGVQKRALGQVWRGLGVMILAAVEKPSGEQPHVMVHVLEIIAHLHHVGLIPESVYQHRPNQDDFTLRQPPTLHLLSSKILTALSDASWRAHEASVAAAKKRENASYFLTHEVPGSHYKMHITEVAPELWLELVLWSCLHGGWILDGAAILEKLPLYQKGRRWSLLSWREVLQAQELDSSTASQGWRLFNRRDHTDNTEERARTHKSLSSEVVTSFIDGLVNLMRVGVGSRGIDPEDLLSHIKKLKHLLDQDSLSLGSATWDSIMIRLLESGGVVPEKRPELLLSLMDLASGYGAEVGSANASSQELDPSSEPRYLFEPSTVSINLLHRTMRSFLENGDISGAMTTMRMLQTYTDSNKQKSLQQFFEALKDMPTRHEEQPFSSSLPPIDFPAFDTQLPVPLLAKLLDLVTDAKLYDLGRWFLLSQDLDGPLIKHEYFDNLTMAASIIRFGTMAGESELVLKIVKRTRKWNSKHQAQTMPAELLTALLSSQVKLRRWESVRGMQDYVLEKPGYRPRSEVLAGFVAELLRLSPEATERTKACKSFTDLLFAWEGLVLNNLRNELYCLLGIMSTIHPSWASFGSSFMSFSSRQQIRLSTADFNTVLGGVLGGYGSLAGKELVDKWCYRPPRTFEPYRAPGGLPTMPHYYSGAADEHEGKPEDIIIVQEGIDSKEGTKLILQGRVYPNRQTVWAVLREVQQEEDRMSERGGATMEERGEVKETLKWAARLLYYMGFDYEDIIRDLGSLAELAELAVPKEGGEFPVGDVVQAVE
jgi:hypothetical protein